MFLDFSEMQPIFAEFLLGKDKHFFDTLRDLGEKSYSPLPCIQDFTLWPMRWVKARLKVL